MQTEIEQRAKEIDIIKDSLKDILKNKKLELEEVFVIISLLADCKSKEDRIEMCAFLIEKFSPLRIMQGRLDVFDKQSMDKIIAKVVGRVAKEDPVRAVEIMRIWMEDGMNLLKMRDKYPDINWN